MRRKEGERKGQKKKGETEGPKKENEKEEKMRCRTISGQKGGLQKRNRPVKTRKWGRDKGGKTVKNIREKTGKKKNGKRHKLLGGVYGPMKQNPKENRRWPCSKQWGKTMRGKELLGLVEM